MGLRGISLGSLLLILLIVLVLFGGKRLRNIAEDLGHALKNFRRGLNESEAEASDTQPTEKPEESQLPQDKS